MAKRPRRRWRIVVVSLLALGALGAGVTWWLQRQATDVAAELLLRAASEAPTLPEVPSWPLDTPAHLRADAEPFAFHPERPTLVVLLHGMSPSPVVDARVGSHAYARHYWGHAFVAALLGAETLYDAAGGRIDRDAWERDAPGGGDPADGLVLAAPAADAAFAALLVTRDGSLGLGEQTRAAAEQIGVGLERLDALVGDTAQLVLIGHSMGGLVSRQLLVNPPLADGPFGVPDDTRALIDELRDRTLYLVTLGTPHEGSQAADRGMLLRDVRRLILDEFVRPNAFARRWLLPLVEETSPYLRIDDAAAQHLRSDVWAVLNDPDDGLLAPHRTRRSDGSLVPVYALASRAPGGRFFADPLVSDRIELELALWYAHQLGIDAEAYVEYTLQMLLADPTMYGLGFPERGWGDADEHPAPTELLDQVTRVPTGARMVTFGPEGSRVAIEVASRVDYLRGPHEREVATRGPIERVWCLLVRCAEEPFVLDVGSVDDVDLSDVDDPTVEVVRDLLLGRPPVAAGAPDARSVGRVGDGQIDADGVVPVDSALGLLMGGDDWPYLAAGREWRVGDEVLAGNWYRPDLEDPSAALPWTYLHHIDQQYDPAVAAWVHDVVLGEAGPDAAEAALSGWR